MIEHRTLGRTGLKISELCLGTLNFGWKTDEASSFAILDAFRAAGGNFLQGAAIAPTFTLPSASTNVTEEIIGRWRTARSIPRGDLVLGTRLSVRPEPGARTNLAELVCQRTLESMRRLNTDYLDLLVIEWNDALLPASQLLEAFDAAVRQCFVRYIGVSNFPSWRVVDLIGRAFRRNQSRMEVLQAEYSLMTRARYEPEKMSLCEEQLLGFIAMSPLARGFLAQSSHAPDRFIDLRRRFARRFDNAYGDAARSAVENVASRHGASAAQVALAWVLHNPTVSSAMIGVRSPQELKELAVACSLRLSPDDMVELSDATTAEEIIVPGARSQAPAFASEVLAN